MIVKERDTRNIFFYRLLSFTSTKTVRHTECKKCLFVLSIGTTAKKTDSLRSTAVNI